MWKLKDLVSKSISAVLSGHDSYCKFLSANDSGETGGHQCGILISTTAKRMLFSDQEIAENHILKKFGSITWQDDFTTKCTFTWYESKKELRITGFGRGFPFFSPEYTGALFVLVRETRDDYLGYMLNTDEDIQDFMDAFGLTPEETNRPIETETRSEETKENLAVSLFVDGLTVDFPTSLEMSSAARQIAFESYRNQMLTTKDPDSALLKWTSLEYRIFKAIEHSRYGSIISKGFSSVDDFVSLANQVLNRRKSRAGKSLEHHLAAIFDGNGIQYTPQGNTEGNKKPDFIFPSEEAYHNRNFPVSKICALAAKTTCKDRWRQILNEADRLRDRNKYLCTMQQGISSQQMDEMHQENVILVVPKPYILWYPRDKRERIWTIGKFVAYIKELEGIG